MRPNQWFIVVTYGDTHQNIIQYFDKYFGVKDLTRVVVVDTKNNMVNGKVYALGEFNSHFEFSGYQVGLNYVLNEDAVSVLDCVFLNDTIFSSHLKIHALQYFKYLTEHHLDLESIAGLVNDFCGLKYIPSYIFRVLVSRHLLIEGDSFLYNYKLDNPVVYSEAYIMLVRRWLYPKGFFSGWYKAIPWKPLDSETYNRKLSAIQLEHSLLEAFNRKTNGDIVDLAMEYPVLKATAFLDRIYVNLLKIKYRFGYLLRS